MIPQDKNYPINFMWPEKISYENPVCEVFYLSGEYDFAFKLKSGEQTDKTAYREDFYCLNWEDIHNIYTIYANDELLQYLAYRSY